MFFGLTKGEAESSWYMVLPSGVKVLKFVLTGKGMGMRLD